MMPSDWALLWRELAAIDIQASAEGETQMVERWRRMARQLDSGEKREPDPLLDFVLGRLEPRMTVLDIGAAIGRWTLPIAERVRQVTAVEPLPGMRQVLLERVSSRGLTNTTVVGVPWMEAEVLPHDVVIAAHATYTTQDLVGFVGRMNACARRTSYLALRVPAHDGVIGELSERVHGRWHDSPNFIVGYNLLLVAGFHPNVLMEQKPVRHWADPTLDDAVARARRHLHLTDTSQDATIREILSRRLRFAEDAYRWPDGMRSALIWWDKPCP
jgi:SAM-dependent methyltransferase